ncbi:MAG: hypothetical protein ABSF92_12085 [Candidatus Acidiferrales bacterium]
MSVTSCEFAAAQRLVGGPKDWVWGSYTSYSGRGAPLVAIDFVD